AEDGIRDKLVTGVQTCALPIYSSERDLLRCDVQPVPHVNRADRDEERCEAAFVIVFGGEPRTFRIAEVRRVAPRRHGDAPFRRFARLLQELMVLKLTVADGKIVEMEAIADRDRLRQLDLAALG